MLFQVCAVFEAVKMTIALKSPSFVLTDTFLILQIFFEHMCYFLVEIVYRLSSLISNESVSLLQIFCTMVLSTFTFRPNFSFEMQIMTNNLVMTAEKIGLRSSKQC